MTEKKLTAIVALSDTDILGIFAQKMEAAFGDRVCVLPTVTILNEVRRQARRYDVEITVELDAETPAGGFYFTVYSVAKDRWGDLAAMYLVDAYDGKTIDFDDVMDGDDEELDDFCDTYPQAAPLIHKYIDA